VSESGFDRILLVVLMLDTSPAAILGGVLDLHVAHVVFKTEMEQMALVLGSSSVQSLA
jgi:hypothetical protein